MNFSKILLENRPNNLDFPPLKKIADCDIFDKFQHVTSELEKNMIANIPLKYAKKQLTQDREDKYVNLFTELHKSLSPNYILETVENIKNRSEKKANLRFAFKCATVYKKKDSGFKRSSGYDFKKIVKQVNLPVNNNVSYVGFSNKEFKQIIKSSSKNSFSNIKESDNNNDNLIELEYTKTTNPKKDSKNLKGNLFSNSNVANIDLLNDDIIENNEDYKYTRTSGTGTFGDQNSISLTNKFLLKT